ncbi:hypothetical protein ISG33_01625 [Glaciecola sp. MH2013]|uniref:hypothetical protein n=1 Tax=Glaciecola sp. MH2013 TaxID=2785524 RepID=UPI00189D5BAC|nr:hypothetical protein [Glaciecola sp. MH2013]MBF7072100.1 hypothetical protein [Glaciecola sp. MH2013]
MRSTSIVKYLLLVSLVFSQGLSMFASASAMSTMQSFASEDSLAICTGKTVRWISASIFYETGELIELEAQESVPDNLHEVVCVLAQLGDAPPSISDCYEPLIVKLALISKVINKVYAATTQAAHCHFSSRAPPSIFFS